VDGQGSLNSTAAAMLGLLAQLGPLNANALSRSADVAIGDYWTLTRSQVYRELETLERRGYVIAGPKGPRGSRDFSLTSRGELALDEWLASGPSGEVVRMPVLLAVRFGARMPRERLHEILEEFSLRHEANRAHYDELEREMRAHRGDPYEIATLRFGRLFEAAVATWLDEIRSTLMTEVDPFES